MPATLVPGFSEHLPAGVVEEVSIVPNIRTTFIRSPVIIRNTSMKAVISAVAAIPATKEIIMSLGNTCMNFLRSR